MRDLKQQARQIFLKTLERIDVAAALNRKVKLTGDHLEFDGHEVDLGQYDEILLAGVGKASIRMGEAVERILGDRVKNGVLVTDRKHRADVKSKIVVGGHPVPTQGSLDAAKDLIELVVSAGKKSLIIFLISGGGSALVELPGHPEVTLEDLQDMNRILIGCGANIREINTIRKHLSAIKGGKLGLRASGARGIAFYVSDVNPGDLRSIASNPVLPEALREQDFLGVISRYSLMDKLPPTVSRAIKRGSATDDDREDRMPVEALLVLDNSAALEAAASVSRELGFKTVVHEDL